jgi:copper chaperone CopZ
MKFEYLIKTDCLACLGVVKEIIKKIDDVKEAELDLETGKVIIDYEGGFSREELAKVIKEKTGYELQ